MKRQPTLKQVQADLQGVFTRISPEIFDLLEAEADREKRSISQQAAMILERYYAERSKP